MMISKILNPKKDKIDCTYFFYPFLFFMNLYLIINSSYGASISGDDYLGIMKLDIDEVITLPLVSKKCEELLKYRDDRIKLRQKSKFLENKIKNIQGIVPKNKKYMKGKLEFIAQEVKQEIYLFTFQISSLEEEIVRKGCPGINL